MLDKKHRSLENRAVIESLAPQIKLITTNLKQNLDDYETIFTEDLEHQQHAFNDLTQQKHKFEEYYKKVPDGPEGNEIRKIIQENFSRLSKILEKLENVITIKADTNRYHSDLSELIHQVNQLLVNPTAIPKNYLDHWQQIKDKTEAINKLIQHANNSGNSSAVQPLNDLISQSVKAEADLTLRYNLWIEFEKERDDFIDQISRARGALNKFEENADLRPLSVAENQYETLKNASSAFNTHHSTLLKLQNLSEQLNPCEMPNRDYKSIATDWEQTNECFENNLNNLLNEINEERGITNDINKITGEIIHLYNDMSSFTRENLVDILDKTLPTLRIEAERLIQMDTDAIHNRRIVIRDKKPSLQDIDFKKCLNELEKTVRQNIEAIDSEKFDTKFLYTIPKPITTDEENLNVVGIDLGMTRCCVAVKRKYGIETVALENIGGRMLPSYIGYDEQHTKCGQIVIDRLRYFPEAVVFDLKRIIGRNAVAADKIWPFKVITIDENLMIKLNTPYGEVIKKPTEVAAVLLKYMKEKTEIFQGQNLEKAVITVPTTFTSAQEEATREAAEIAGWKTIVLLPEPIAAAFAYFIDTKISNNSNILLFDLGGGTLDVCVFKISNNQILIKSKKGDSRLGGRDFDNLLLNYFINKLKLDHDITVSGGRKFKLLLECQTIKHNLTDRETDQLDVEEYDQNKPGFIKISQQDFRELSQDLLNRIKNTIRSALYSSGYKSSQISKVLHVGGGCRMPMIKELLHKMFPAAEPCCKENPEEVVAVGAAYYAYNIFPTN